MLREGQGRRRTGWRAGDREKRERDATEGEGGRRGTTKGCTPGECGGHCIASASARAPGTTIF
eukprot:1066222-Rhodomonas_salina.2